MAYDVLLLCTTFIIKCTQKNAAGHWLAIATTLVFYADKYNMSFFWLNCKILIVLCVDIPFIMVCLVFVRGQSCYTGTGKGMPPTWLA